MKFLIVISLFMIQSLTVFAQKSVEVLSYESSDNQPEFYNAIYVNDNHDYMRARHLWPTDNGKTWQHKSTTVKRLDKIYTYSRRVAVSSISDGERNLFITFFNALDVPNLSKDVAEPVQGLKNYYIRYRVSNDDSESWLYDESIIEKGKFTSKNPLQGVEIGKNAFYLGDIGSKPIFTKEGAILLPAHATVMSDVKNNKNNKGGLYNPNKGYTYTEVVILKGIWNGRTFDWKLISRLKGDPLKTTRGLIEPTIVQINSKTIICIMRGSNGGDNDPDFKLPSYKWISYSKDNGETWSTPKPWKYSNGDFFFSPSAMSTTIRHSNGKTYWIGNINETNSKQSQPRFPLVIGEIDSRNMGLIKSSIVVLDTFKKGDENKGDLDLGHVSVLEDRKTSNLIISYPRIFSKVKKREWVLIKAKVND